MAAPSDPFDGGLTALRAPAGLRASRLRVGTDEIIVLSVPVATQSLPASLSAAEREVAQEILAGRSNAQIAEARGTSVRTVANQVNAILRKSGADSRAELMAGIRRPAP
jgi:DNA-binding CsgD family transcriptional regulator